MQFAMTSSVECQVDDYWRLIADRADWAYGATSTARRRVSRDRPAGERRVNRRAEGGDQASDLRKRCAPGRDRTCDRRIRSTIQRFSTVGHRARKRA